MVRLPNSAGMAPVNSFQFSRRNVRLDRLPSSAGIDPVNWLFQRDSELRCDRLPNSAGMDPVNWLLLSRRFVKLERLPNSAGIVPDKFRSSPDVSILVTRRGVPDTVTASQLAMGVSADQFRVAVPLRVSRAASRVSQSAIRPGLLAASSTALPVEHVPVPTCWAVDGSVVALATFDARPVPAELMADTR